MNYIKLINGFHNFKDTHYISTRAQSLWFNLSALFNKTGWKSQTINVTNMCLMAKCSISSEKNFIKCRSELVKLGLIEYIKGFKGSPGKYKLITNKLIISQDKNELNMSTKNVLKGNVQKITKQKRTKNNIYSDNICYIKKYYEKYISRPNQRDVKILKDLMECYGVEMLKYAIDNVKGHIYSANYLKPILENIVSKQKKLKEDTTYNLEEFEKEDIFL